MPSFEFTSPEGTRYQIDGPEGATPQQAFGMLQRNLKVSQHPSPPTSPAPPAAARQVLGSPMQKADPLGPYLLNALKQGVGDVATTLPGAADALLNQFRAPIRDVASVVAGKPGEMLKPMSSPLASLVGGGAQRILGVNADMRIPQDARGTPRTTAEFLGNLARMAPSSILPGGAAVKLAERPLLAAAKELGGLSLAAEGQTMGAHLAPKGHEDLGAFIGSLSGPLAFQSAMDAVSRGGNWARSKAGVTGFSEDARRQMGRADAAKDLVPQMQSPVSKKNIEEAAKISAQIPGFGENLTLGRVTGSPAIRSMERHFASTDPEVLELAQKREQALRDAVFRHAEERFPGAPETTPFSGVQRTYRSQLGKLDEQRMQLENQQRALASNLQRGDIGVNGARVRQVRERLMGAAKQQANTMYRAVDDAAKAQGLKIDMADVDGLARSINRDAGNAFQDDPGVIGKILRRYREHPGETREITTPIGRKIHLGRSVRPKDTNVEFSEFHSLVREANAEASQLAIAAKQGNIEAPQKLRKVEQVRDVLQAKLTQMENDPAAAGVGSMLRDANRFYRDKYTALFRRGAGGEIGKANALGPLTPDAKLIPSLLFTKGDASGVRDYLAMLQGDTGGYDALKSGVLDMLAKATVRNGLIDPSALRNFLRAYREPLSALPELRASIGTVAAANDALRSNAEKLTQQRALLSQSMLAKVAKGENPDSLISQSLHSPQRLQTILDHTASNDERQALARAYVDHVMQKPAPQLFLASNREALTRALGKQQMNDLDTIANAQAIIGRVEAPSHVTFGTLDDPLKELTGTTIPQAISEQKSVTQRFASKPYAYARVAIRWWNKLRNETRQKVLIDSIYNPPTADALAQYLKTGSKSAAEKLNWHIISYGLRAVSTAHHLASNPAISSAPTAAPLMP